MILTAHQPTYLPWLGLFDKIARADVFCLFDCVQQEDSGFENRNQIRGRDRVQWLTVPVRRSRETLIRDVEICTDQPWRRKHWRAIELAYRASPFFEVYRDELRAIITVPQWGRLAPLNFVLTTWLMEKLGLGHVKTVSASDYDFQGTKSALVLDMAVKLGASRYVFGSKGRDYADVEAFAAAGIAVEFHDFTARAYHQQHGGPFVPNLSAIDALFNLGPAAAGLVGGKRT